MSEPEIQTEESREDQGMGFAWFITGVIIGAAAAVLFAPKSGKETRRLIGDKTQQSRDAVTGTGRDLFEQSKEMFEKGRQMVDDAADLIDRGRKLVRG